MAVHWRNKRRNVHNLDTKHAANAWAKREPRHKPHKIGSAAETRNNVPLELCHKDGTRILPNHIAATPLSICAKKTPPCDALPKFTRIPKACTVSNLLLFAVATQVQVTAAAREKADLMRRTRTIPIIHRPDEYDHRELTNIVTTRHASATKSQAMTERQQISKQMTL